MVKNSFLMPFPSEEEMKIMNDVEFWLKYLGLIVTFSEWSEVLNNTCAFQVSISVQCLALVKRVG
jgi:hypothetical protein